MLKKSLFLSIFLAFLSFLLFIYKIEASTIYHSDFARDLFEILKISQGNLTLLGPKLSFGGLYTAPYYFYLYTPVFLLSGFNLLSIPIFNSILFATAIGYFAKKVIDKFSALEGVAVTILFSLITLTIFAARNPNNGSAQLSFLLILLTYIYFEDINHWLKLTIMGFVFGVLINFSFSTVTLLPAVLALLLFKLKDRKKILFFVPGFITAFLPILASELKSNFIQIRNTFGQKTYEAWLKNESVVRGKAGKKNIFENMFYIANEIKPFIGFNPLIAFLVSSGAYLFNKTRVNKFLLLNGLLAFILSVFILRFQLAPHYLYPVAFFTFFSLVLFILESRSKWLMIVMIVLVLMNFPRHLYKPATITAAPFEKAVKYSIEKGLVKKDSRFNVVHIAHPNAIIGFEYRYFFQKNGFVPMSEFEYAGSDTLLMFTERKNFDPTNFKTWEVEQFGLENLKSAQKYQVENIQIYRVDKHQL